ncbi:MAG: Nudix family hydrolase [Gammaproteobacteria bacterium]
MPITGARRSAPPRRPAIYVSAAALIDATGRVLISRRPAGLHQGGLWEFPGGKVEPNETALEALSRELTEELGIVPRAARPLIQVYHDYGDRAVWLDVWRVASWSGEPRGREGQAVRWMQPKCLDASLFPPADAPVIAALQLPPVYLITPEPGLDQEGFLQTLAGHLRGGIRLIQLRAKSLEMSAYRTLARRALTLCQAHGATLLLNAEPDLARDVGASGVHLTGARLLRLTHRPLGDDRLVGASCHDARELAHACHIGVDFAVLSPVRFTSSHPASTPLGWQRFQALVGDATVPVYGLGGLGPADLDTAWVHGGQGVACTSVLWQHPPASV